MIIADEDMPSIVELRRENIDEVEALKESAAEKQIRIFCK